MAKAPRPPLSPEPAASSSASGSYIYDEATGTSIPVTDRTAMLRALAAQTDDAPADILSFTARADAAPADPIPTAEEPQA